MKIYDSIIYEYNETYFIIQRSRQSRNVEDSVSENVALAASLPNSTDYSKLGEAALVALDQYDVVEPAYKPWELKELRKQLCGWVGAKSYPGLLKNSRIVLMVKDFAAETIKIIPFDNNNIKPWESMIDTKIISLPIYANHDSVGQAIDAAFSISTYHPERKNKS